MVMQMGIIIFLGVFGGQQLDKRWQTDPWMTLVLSLAGIAIAFYVTLKDFFVSDKKD